MRFFRTNKKFAVYISLAVAAVLAVYFFAYPYLQSITIVADLLGLSL